MLSCLNYTLRKNAIRYESRLNTRETKFESFISCLSEILGSPNIIFMSEYINRLTIEYYNLKIFTNSELDATLTKIVSECRSKYNSYQSDYITNLWDYYVRLKGYEDEELIEPGTNMIQFKYVLEEEIHNEIIAYKDKHAFSEDYIVSQLENISSKMKKVIKLLVTLVPNDIKRAHKSLFYKALRAQNFYSNSIVAGGFPVQSYNTRFTPFTSFTILLVTTPRTSQGSSADSAVMKSEVNTALKAIA